MLKKILGSIFIIILLYIIALESYSFGYSVAAESRGCQKCYREGYKNAEIMLETKRLEDSIKSARNETINSRR
jgi:hypothetical protein